MKVKYRNRSIHMIYVFHCIHEPAVGAWNMKRCVFQILFGYAWKGNECEQGKHILLLACIDYYNILYTCFIRSTRSDQIYIGLSNL